MAVGRTSQEATANRDGFVEGVFSSALATYDIFSIYIGDRLGFYAALNQEPSTAKVLAHRTGTDERYIRDGSSSKRLPASFAPRMPRRNRANAPTS